MGGGQYAGSAPSMANVGAGLIEQYLNSLPQFLNAAQTGQTSADLAAARSAAATTPIYSQAGLQNLLQFGVPFAQAGAAATGAAQMSGAQTQADILSRLGPQEAAAFRSADVAGNPEYYKTLGTATSGLQNLIGSINLNGLSGSERSEVERSLGQSQTATGNLGLDNATNAVGNAMTFGSALQAKRDALGQALNTATSLLSQSKSGFNPLSVMGNASGSNLGTTNFTGVAPTGNQAWNFAGGTLGTFGNLANTQQQQQYASNRANSFAGILGSQTEAVGNLCCFIFLEIYNGKLPWYVRFCRDHFYAEDPTMAIGYRRMASWLVPMMRRWSIVRSFVNRFMVGPMTKHGGYLLNEEGMTYSRRCHFTTKFWFSVWKLLAY